MHILLCITIKVGILFTNLPCHLNLKSNSIYSNLNSGKSAITKMPRDILFAITLRRNWTENIPIPWATFSMWDWFMHY